MNAIEAVNVPVPQPEVPKIPPCEWWVTSHLDGDKWFYFAFRSQMEAEYWVSKLRRKDPTKEIRLFRCSDQPPPPVDEAKVAEAWSEYCNLVYLDGEPHVGRGLMRMQRDTIARFVADLVAKGVPRKEQTDAK